MLYIILIIANYSHQYKRVVFHWNLRDTKSSRVLKTLLIIISDYIIVVVWMVLILLIIFNFPSLFSSFLKAVPIHGYHTFSVTQLEGFECS